MPGLCAAIGHHAQSEENIVVNLSGRGDKDVEQVARMLAGKQQ